MAKPTILFYSGGFAPIGGVETFISELASELALSGYDVVIHGWDCRSEEIAKMRSNGVTVRLSPFRWGCRWHLPDWLATPLGLLRARRASVIIYGKTFPPGVHLFLTWALRLLRSTGRSFLITPYRPSELWPFDRNSRGTRRLLNSFNTIICQSESFKDDLRKLGYSKNIFCLPYFPPAVRPQLMPYPTNGLVLGFLGRLEAQKNLPSLLRVVRQLCESGDFAVPPRLLIFGDGSERQSLLTAAKRLGISTNVHFAGRISRDEIHDAISKCHMLCFTSISEGQPLASLEGFASGRPAVAFGVGAFPDMLTDHTLGWSVKPGDENAAQDAITMMFKNQSRGDLRPEMVAEAYSRKFRRSDLLYQYLRVIS